MVQTTNSGSILGWYSLVFLIFEKARLAQLVERTTLNRVVMGLEPHGGRFCLFYMCHFAVMFCVLPSISFLPCPFLIIHLNFFVWTWVLLVLVLVYF